MYMHFDYKLHARSLYYCCSKLAHRFSLIFLIQGIGMVIGLNHACAQVTYTWNGSVSSNWGNGSNWTPNGVPGSDDVVVLSNVGYNPIFDGTDAPSTFTINSGTFDINGYNFAINGSATLNGGVLTNGTFTVNGSESQTCTIGSITTNSSCNLKITSESIIINGGTFNGSVNMTKTGTGTSSGSGGAVFNYTTNISVNGGGTLRINGGNTYNGITTFTVNGSSTLIPEYTSSSTYNGVLNINNTGTGKISMAYSGNSNAFNKNINIRISAGGTVNFGENSGTSGLASTRTINAYGSGITSGVLRLNNFIQLGSTAQSLSGSGGASLYLEKGTEFNGVVSFSFSKIHLNGAIYQQAATFSITDSDNSLSDGGNTFQADATIINNGSGNVILSNMNKDIYYGKATFTNTSTGNISIAYNDNSSPTQFNDNIILNNTSSGHILFGQGTGSAVLASGKTMQVGGSGVSNGEIHLMHFTQNGSTAQSLNFAGTASLILGSGCVFNGDINFAAPQLQLNGATFNNTVSLEKTGASSNISSGGNSFHKSTIIKNSGSGNLTLADVSSDTFYDNVYFIKTNDGDLFPASNTTCTFAKNISTLGSNSSITFGNAIGTVEMIGTDAHYIQGDASYPPLFNRLSANCIGSITLQVPVEVSTLLSLTNGIIVTSTTNPIHITNETTTVELGNSNSYIDGPFQITMSNNGSSILNLPIGKSGDYRPAKLTPVHNKSTSYTYTAELFNGDANALSCSPIPTGISHLSGVHYWKIHRSDNSDGLSSAVVELYYGTNDGVTDYANLKVIKSSGSDCPSTWINTGGTATGNNSGSITSGMFTSFSSFTIGNVEGGGNPLPIQLANFDGDCINNKHTLRWTTLSEMNCKQFILQRSSDGRIWMGLDSLPGSGTSFRTHHYQLATVSSSDTYYRLKQVDYDGKFEFTAPILVKSCTISNTVVEVLPNIGDGYAIISYAGISTSDVAYVAVINILNKAIIQNTDYPLSQIDLRNHPSGIYMVQVGMRTGEIYRCRIVKQ